MGFGCRVLAATGGDDQNSNAFCLLHDQIKATGGDFPKSLGIVPSAYQFAVSLPLLKQGKAWSYISGCVNGAAIEQKNHSPYAGQSRSGFSTAQPGDILCFGYVGDGSNGHFMILTKAPQPLPTLKGVTLPPFVARVYNVSVYDCTAEKGLHIVDSRRDGYPDSCGIGFGELYIFTNSSDQPVGYIFGWESPGQLQSPHFVEGLNLVKDQSQVVAISVGRFQ